jgi:hypothetical protein
MTVIIGVGTVLCDRPQHPSLFLVLVLVLVVLLGRRLPLEPLHQPCFVLGIFEIGSRELFAQAGFKPRSS